MPRVIDPRPKSHDLNEGEEDDDPVFVLHVYLHAADETEALDAARELARDLRDWPGIDHGLMSITREDWRGDFRRLYCNRQMPGGGGRCGEEDQHAGGCTARST
jgi:hypothetical protein